MFCPEAYGNEADKGRNNRRDNAVDAECLDEYELYEKKDERSNESDNPKRDHRLIQGMVREHKERTDRDKHKPIKDHPVERKRKPEELGVWTLCNHVAAIKYRTNITKERRTLKRGEGEVKGIHNTENREHEEGYQEPVSAMHTLYRSPLPNYPQLGVYSQR